MKILVSNDDGYQARGVHELIGFLREFGEVIAVCPDGPRSGQSMALTFENPLRMSECQPPFDGTKLYKVSGTPVDCVKLSLQTLFKGEKPDLIVAGINHGSNSAVNVLYSGTMGAVFEGCMIGVPSVGFSLTTHSKDADFSFCKKFVKEIIAHTLQNELPEGVCLNVNIPDNCEPKGMMLTRSCRGHWTEEYKRYVDPNGKDFYWLTGHFINEEPEATDTDEWALNHDFVSVTPTSIYRDIHFDELPEWIIKNIGNKN